MPYKRKINDYMTLLSNESNSNEGELLIYGDIVDIAYFRDEISPTVVIEALEGLGAVKVLNMHINSYGGSTVAGNAIIAILDDYRRKNGTTINAYIEGIAASMGSGIPMVADKIYMASNALFMVHKPYTIVMGNMNDLQHEIEILEKAEDGLIKNYMRHFNGSEEDLRALMEKESWLTAEEALDYGFCDEITEGVAIAASAKGYVINKQKFTELPDEAVAKLVPLAKANKPTQQIQDKGVDTVEFTYDENLKAFGISEDKFKELGVNAETALIIAKTSANTVLPQKMETIGVTISYEAIVDALGDGDLQAVSPKVLLDLAKKGLEFDEKAVDKAKSYDKLMESAIDNAVKSYIRAKGENADETRAKKMLSNFTYDEVLAQQAEWDNEAEIVLNVGKHISVVDDFNKSDDALINLDDYNF